LTYLDQSKIFQLIWLYIPHWIGMNQYFSAAMLFSQYGDFVCIFLFPLIHHFKSVVGPWVMYTYIQITIAHFHRPDANCKDCQNNITADNTCLTIYWQEKIKTNKNNKYTNNHVTINNSFSQCKFLQSIYIDTCIFFNIEMIPSINDVNTGTFVSPALILTSSKS